MTGIALERVLTAQDMDAAIRVLGGMVGDCFPLRHQFAPGVYAREITMPKGAVVVGKQHKTQHFNIISQGVVSFWVDGQIVTTVRAPYTFVSEAGLQKVLVIHEETVWTTIHATDETDLATLEALLIEPNTSQAALRAAGE